MSRWVEFQHTAARRRLVRRVMWTADKDGSFNTQPPEGGWALYKATGKVPTLFQHTAARRRLGRFLNGLVLKVKVSTHSRPKAAGCLGINFYHLERCFNTQPPEGGWDELLTYQRFFESVSTHSRPKAAGRALLTTHCFNEFQHTAARRRLGVGLRIAP